MRTSLTLSVLLMVAGCGSTEPENILFVSGTVVAASAGSGYAAGQGIDGAQVSLRYQPPLEPSSEIFDSDIADVNGAWSMQTGPPRGQQDPNCTTLSVSAIRVGFTGAVVPLGSLCGIGPGEVTNVEIALSPN